MKNKLAIIVGELNPMTVYHEKLIEKAAEESEQVLVMIRNSNRQPTWMTPYRYSDIPAEQWYDNVKKVRLSASDDLDEVAQHVISHQLDYNEDPSGTVLYHFEDDTYSAMLSSKLPYVPLVIRNNSFYDNSKALGYMLTHGYDEDLEHILSDALPKIPKERLELLKEQYITYANIAASDEPRVYAKAHTRAIIYDAVTDSIGTFEPKTTVGLTIPMLRLKLEHPEVRNKEYYMDTTGINLDTLKVMTSVTRYDSYEHLDMTSLTTTYLYGVPKHMSPLLTDTLEKITWVPLTDVFNDKVLLSGSLNDTVRQLFAQVNKEK